MYNLQFNRNHISVHFDFELTLCWLSVPNLQRKTFRTLVSFTVFGVRTLVSFTVFGVRTLISYTVFGVRTLISFTVFKDRQLEYLLVLQCSKIDN